MVADNPSSVQMRTTSDKFLVIAIGLPVPMYPGTPLDPPLRSRFAARAAMPPHAEDQLEALGRSFPGVPKENIQRAVAVTGALRTLAEPIGEGEPLPRCPYGAAESIVSLTQRFPHIGTLSALRRVFPFPLSAVASSATATADKAEDLAMPLDARQLRVLGGALDRIGKLRPVTRCYELAAVAVVEPHGGWCDLTFSLSDSDGGAGVATGTLAVGQMSAKQARGAPATRYFTDHTSA